jgi:hypothetical protein
MCCSHGSRARAMNENSTPQLEFRQKLAQKMIENTLDAPPKPVVAPIPVRRVQNVNHTLVKRKPNEGSWNPDSCRFKTVGTDYVRLRCHGCQKKCRTYCSCDHVMPLWAGCYALHCK